MASPIPYDYRVKIIRSRQSGKPFRQIALEVGYSESGVKKIWRRFQANGLDGLQTNYTNSGRRSPYQEEMHQLIDSVKDGEQGAPYIRSVLMEQFPDKVIPHERTIQRWLKAKGANRPKGKPRQRQPKRAKEVHHTWQIDGKEQVRLKTGEQVSWINIADEASGSELYAGVSPLSKNE